MTTTLFLAATLSAAVPTTQIRAKISGSIEASIGRVAPKAASALGAQIARLIRWRGDMVRNVQPGDEIVVVYETGAQPELVALRYQGTEISLQAYRFTGHDGVPRFYDEEGRLIEPRVKRSPVPGAFQITETVQRGSGKRKHNGIDFKAPEGTSVILPFDARVTRVNWSRRVNGNCVEVRYESGKLGRFLHLASIHKSVRPGVVLASGASVGTVGNTGRSSAPHLHYEIRGHADKVYDPLEVHGVEAFELTGADVPAFTVARAQLARELGGDAVASVR